MNRTEQVLKALNSVTQERDRVRLRNQELQTRLAEEKVNAAAARLRLISICNLLELLCDQMPCAHNCASFELDEDLKRRTCNCITDTLKARIMKHLSDLDAAES